MHPRLLYLLLTLITILFGLSTRKFSAHLPHFVAEHFGDALWAAMVYFGFRFLLPYKGLLFAAVCALIFSFGIEFSQLYQAEWINEIRRTKLGALVLGSGFLWVDLPRYAAGVAVAFAADNLLQRSKNSPAQTNHRL